MDADIKFKMPFNFVQVLIAAFCAMSLSVLAYFVGMAAGASMQFSGGLFENLDFIHIIRFTVPPIVILGFLTFLIGRSQPGFCRVAQVTGVAVVLVSAVVQFFYAEGWGTAVTVAIMHLILAVFWYVAVNNTNHLSRPAKVRG